MKKAPHILATLFLGVLGVAFFVPLDASAYTMANESVETFNSQSGVLIYNPVQIERTGTIGSFVSYFFYDNSIATSGTRFLAQVYLADAVTSRDCLTSVFTPASEGWTLASPGAYSVIGPFSGTQCSYSVGDEITIRVSNLDIPFANNLIDSGGRKPIQLGSPSKDFYLLTTDTASSTIYQIERDYLGLVGTSTVAELCSRNVGTSTSFLDSAGASFSNGLCNVGVFLFVPSQEVLDGFGNLASSTQSKIPFSYYYDFRNILSGSAATSTSNFSVLAVDLRATGVGSTSPWATVLPSSFNYLSSTTITAYVSPTLYDLLFLLMRSAIWIAVLFHIYHRIIPRHVTHA